MIVPAGDWQARMALDDVPARVKDARPAFCWSTRTMPTR